LISAYEIRGTVRPHFGERSLVRGADRLIIDRRVPERCDHRIVVPLGEVAKRIVGLLLRELVDELVQALLGCHNSDCTGTLGTRHRRPGRHQPGPAPAAL
jgi:hypothetical protein